MPNYYQIESSCYSCKNPCCNPCNNPCSKMDDPPVMPFGFDGFDGHHHMFHHHFHHHMHHHFFHHGFEREY